jgi:lipopolysaccharide/colanic/teichoic acid biosynthesis glycosyltransferase
MMRLARVLTPVCSLATPIAIGIYHSAKNFGAWDNISIRYSPVWLVIYGLAFVVSSFVFGVPTLIERFNQAVLGSALAAVAPLGAASVFFVIYNPLIPRLVVVGTPAVLFVVYLFFSLLHAWSHRSSVESDRVGFVVSESEWANIVGDLDQPPERRFRVEWTQFVGDLASAPEHDISGVTVLVLGAEAQLDERTVAAAALAHERGVRVRSLTVFYEEWLGKLPVEELERTSLWFDIRDVHELQYGRLKRVMDLCVAFCMLPVFLISVPFVLLGNAIGSRGPLIFRQERVGLRGTTFTMWKYRSMVTHDAAAGAGQWTEQNDPRITRFGKLLRKSHLDELPQVVNVLAGDLSVVGPRPEQVHYVHELEQKIPFYGMRHVVKPGLTGWAQVKYPYGASESDALEKLQYELFYLKHQSAGFDVRICARTVRSILFGDGR